MRKFYEINADIERAIMEGTNYETGEFEAPEILEMLCMERDQKFENVALFVKDSRAEAEAIKNEIATLKARMDKLNRNADGAERWLAENLAGQKFSTSKVECSFRRSEAVEVDEIFCEWAETFEQDQFINIKHTVTPNKTEIKKFLKAGGTLEHCQLVEKQNIQIK